MARVRNNNGKGKAAERAVPSYPRATFLGGPPPATVEECKARTRKILATLGWTDPSDRALERSCRQFWGQRYDLLELGVPFDLALPAPKDEQLKRERDYDRDVYRPLVSKAKRTADRLTRLLGRLRDAQEKHPAEEWWRNLEVTAKAYSAAVEGAASPKTPSGGSMSLEASFRQPTASPEESWDARKVRLVRALAKLLDRELEVIGYVHRTPQGAAKQVDRAAIEDALVLAGLGPSQIAKVTKYLGKEAPAQADSDIAERVRKRLKRKSPSGHE